MADRGRHFAAPHRGHRSWGQRFFLGLTSLLTVAVFAAAGFVVYIYGKVGELVRFTPEEVPVEAAPPGEPENYLIVGSDSRANVDPDDPNFSDVLPGVVEGNRSDTIIVARIDPEDAQIQMMSFPRDLWVPLADGHGEGRINEAYGYGRDVLIDTIRDNFGITINHYVEIDFTGFQRLVSAIGGVPVYLDGEYRDRASGLTEIGPGCVTLEGDVALAFARARHLERRLEGGSWHTDPTGDLGRITRQQFFIREALAKVVELDPFTNVVTFTNLLDVFTDSVGVDAGMSNDRLRELRARFSGFDPETINNFALPTSPRTTSGGAAVLDLLPGAEPIFNIFRGLEPGEVTPEMVTVTVQNGTAVDRQAANTAEALDVVGFTTVVDGDAEPPAATTVFYSAGSENAAQLVARHLTSQAVYELDPNLGLNEVRLVTGPDFTTVVRQPWAAEVVALPTTTTTTTAPVETTTTTTGSATTTPTTAPTTTTTAIGYLPQRPDGTTC